MRHTKPLIAVAVVLMADPGGQHYGYQLSQESGVRHGVLYPMLRRMLEEGWLTDGWEDATAAAGRPPRRYYELTDHGRRELAALAALVPTPVTRVAQLGIAR